MNKEIIKQIIIENQEFIKDVNLYERDNKLEKQGNYVLIGARRAGKTYTMLKYIKDTISRGTDLSQILYINFEDERLIELKASDLNQIVEAFRELFNDKPLIFLDEIQNIQGWEKFARRLADQNYHVFITGSNAQMLSREIATILGGRFQIYEVFPLSFEEYLKMNHLIPEKNWEYSSQRFEIRKLFETYFYFGGFPEINKFDEKKLWLRNLYSKIFFGDIITRYKIRNDFALKILVKKLAESVHDEITFTRIRNIIQSSGIKIGTATIIEYLSHLNESWLVFKIENYFAKITEKETSGKYYFIDNGILSLFLLNPETILLENIVALQLKRKYGNDFYFLKKNYEVDFYVPEEKLMLQVSHKQTKPETENREINAMQVLSDTIETKSMVIITLDIEKQVDSGKNKISFIPVWKWLLDFSK